eukprot:146541_1
MDNKRRSSNEEENMNQICLCGRKLTTYPYGWDQCYSCCKEIEKEENTYYYCGEGECTYRKMRGTSYFMVCSACYGTVYSSSIDAKRSFLFCKVASLIEQIRKGTKQCKNNDEQRRHLYYVYLILYEQCIAKLNVFMNEREYDQIEDMFNVFYGGVMNEINHNIDLMELGVASDTFTDEKKRNKKRKKWEKMNKISSEWKMLRNEETLEEQKEGKASECEDMRCNDTAKCGSRKRIQLVMRCYRGNFLNRFDYHAM